MLAATNSLTCFSFEFGLIVGELRESDGSNPRRLISCMSSKAPPVFRTLQPSRFSSPTEFKLDSIYAMSLSLCHTVSVGKRDESGLRVYARLCNIVQFKAQQQQTKASGSKRVSRNFLPTFPPSFSRRFFGSTRQSHTWQLARVVKYGRLQKLGKGELDVSEFRFVIGQQSVTELPSCQVKSNRRLCILLMFCIFFHIPRHLGPAKRRCSKYSL